MAITLLFPYIAITASGQKIPMQGPTVESLPVMPDTQGENLVLTKQVGIFGPGAYQWSNNRWQFILSYTTICSELYGVSRAFVAMPNAGDNLIPVGDSGAAIVSVYRNGTKLAANSYSVTSLGISLTAPTRENEVYVVIQDSPLTPTTPIAGGGIPDAPVNDTAYVRKNAAWENLQNELNEGVFTGQ